MIAGRHGFIRPKIGYSPYSDKRAANFILQVIEE